MRKTTAVIVLLVYSAVAVLNPKEAAKNTDAPSEVPSVPTVGSPAPIVFTPTATTAILTLNGATIRLIRGR
jgi:hypothetical protein